MRSRRRRRPVGSAWTRSSNGCAFREPSRLLADPVASARVARATRGAVTTLVANGVVDNHGTSPPELLARPVRLRGRDTVLVPIEDVPDLRQRLDAAGARHVTEPLGDHVLVRVLAPLASTAPCHVPVRRHDDAGTPQRMGVARV